VKDEPFLLRVMTRSGASSVIEVLGLRGAQENVGPVGGVPAAKKDDATDGDVPCRYITACEACDSSCATDDGHCAWYAPARTAAAMPATAYNAASRVKPLLPDQRAHDSGRSMPLC
jgi:hypothetical protein